MRVRSISKDRSVRVLDLRIITCDANDSVGDIFPHRLHVRKDHVLDLVLVEIGLAALMT